ncbi:MAG: metal-dependent hydrolase [Verrucomicrobia bacterium]|nr:metal-dependent hydrolase [Verrucomicrobiota bacterium]
MDNVTHAALGIAAGIAVRRAGASLPAAALAGLLAGEGPDLDVFIRSAGDPLVSFRWHRHFTHSFAFAPVWAVLAALLSAWCFRRRPDVHWRDLLLPGLAGALSHVLCDACTSYGTMLLWPFDHGRYAWDCLPIIDLVATLPVLVLAILAWKRGAPRLAAYGLLWFTAYALLGVWQHARAETALRRWFETERADRRVERVAVKPTALNLVVWRCVWLEAGRWHTAAVRVMPFTAPQVIVGETRAALTPTSPGLPAAGSPGAAFIADFSRFTQGWNSFTADGPAVLVGDIRFGMLPTSARPLWSVRCEPGAPTTVVMDRSLRDGDWGRFGRMIAGTHPDFVTLR